ncbi:hypothetical protein AVO45_14665 [Ruegeria marisrubri]|uniref:J domain-containing protein n=1 Tax=Ruegeria marisrubri TaxID=1685379 RepID=A0A0X3TC24_9RHOB|nr:J domain-containing protein [Ruegeria marisrubri]KUJ73328.1 hypothetical protein AVO45_14665 [Ruegeria marisrubri]
MSPIERVRARAAALEELGVASGAGPEEIREAWRRAAFDAHPDRAGGDGDDFARVKAAYDVLRKAGLTGPDRSESANRAPRPRRPRVAPRDISFSDQEKAACQALLDANLVNAENIVSVTPADAGNGGIATATPWSGPKDHVPVAVRCEGRRLTYFVNAAASTGINRVALPASALATSRNARPTLVEFRCAKAGPGEVTVPEGLRSQRFPGARKVSIRFLGDTAGA